MPVGQVQGLLRRGLGVEYHGLQESRVLPADNVVVAVEQVQPPFFLEPGEHAVDVLMNLRDVAQLPVLPQLLPVPQLDIRKTVSVVMFHGRIVQMLVLQEIVRGGAHAPVTVADEHIPGALAERQHQGLGKGPVQAAGGAHGLFLPRGLHLRQHLGRRHPFFLWQRLWKRRRRISFRKHGGI